MKSIETAIQEVYNDQSMSQTHSENKSDDTRKILNKQMHRMNRLFNNSASPPASDAINIQDNNYLDSKRQDSNARKSQESVGYYGGFKASKTSLGNKLNAMSTLANI